jgi:hypothetical protein
MRSGVPRSTSQGCRLCGLGASRACASAQRRTSVSAGGGPRHASIALSGMPESHPVSKGIAGRISPPDKIFSTFLRLIDMVFYPLVTNK